MSTNEEIRGDLSKDSRISYGRRSTDITRYLRDKYDDQFHVVEFVDAPRSPKSVETRIQDLADVIRQHPNQKFYVGLRLPNSLDAKRPTCEALLSALHGLKNIVAIEFPSDAEMTDKAASSLASMQNLHYLGMKGMKSINDKQMQTIVDGNSHLEFLHLSSPYSTIGDRWMENIASKLPHLQELEFNGMGDFGMSQLAGLKNITSLGIACNDPSPMTDAGAKYLSSLSSLSKLKINHAPNVTDVGFSAIAALPALETLSIDWCKGFSDVSGIIQMPKLRYLHINGTGIGTDALSQLSTIPAVNIDLEHVDREKVADEQKSDFLGGEQVRDHARSVVSSIEYETGSNFTEAERKNHIITALRFIRQSFSTDEPLSDESLQKLTTSIAPEITFEILGNTVNGLKIILNDGNNQYLRQWCQAHPLPSGIIATTNLESLGSNDLTSGIK